MRAGLFAFKSGKNGGAVSPADGGTQTRRLRLRRGPGGGSLTGQGVRGGGKPAGAASGAFAVNPDLLLMDEPYGQLDVKLRFYLEDELVNIWRKLNSTVLFVTHNIEEAVYVAERILVLTNKPTKIKAEIPVDLPRPRNLIDPKFVELRKQVTELIRWW